MTIDKCCEQVIGPGQPGAGSGNDPNAIHKNVAAEIITISEKVAPIAADVIVIEDSADFDNKKRVQVGNLPSGSTDPNAIHDNVAAEIVAVTEKTTPVSADVLLIEDSVDFDNKKRLQIGNLPPDGDAIHDNVAGEIVLVTEKTAPDGADVLLIEDSVATDNKKRVQISNLPGSKPRTVYFWADPSSNLSNYRSRLVGASGAHRFNFMVPDEFASLVSLELMAIPVGTFVAQSIDLDSDYHAAGENYQNHVESDHASTFSGTAATGLDIDISSVFSVLSAGDRCGVLVDHQAIGSAINYIGVKMVYNVG